ncbi:MAG: hypothetical protein ACRENH_06175 [Gemmatimonadaceae bacterium]
MTLRTIVAVVALGSLGACASGGSKPPAAAPSTTAAASTSTAPKRGSANLITQSEIESTSLETLYDVIERLRPNMMRTRGQMGRLSAGAGMSTIKVYFNGTLIGDTSALRGIQSSSVKQVEYLSSSDATTRFGTGNDAGAILVTSK